MRKETKSLRNLVLLLAVAVLPALLTSQTKSNSLNVGVAPVNGQIQLIAGNPEKSGADFTIFSADTGTLQTKITFKSTRTTVQNDAVNVVGDLTLTVIERDAIYSPVDDYAGPVLGERHARSVTHEVVFVFPAGSLAQQNVTGRISAIAVVGHENFPELLPALYAAHWPPVLENETCQMPATVGEDYRGPSCTGVVVETQNADAVPADIADDYRGSELAAPSGNNVEIVLNLQVTGKGPVAIASFFVG